MANKANNARNAVKAAKQETTAATRPAPQGADGGEADEQRFIGKVCKVNGGRKHDGETVKVFHVTKGNDYRKPVALAEGNEALKAGEAPLFINPKYLEIVGDMAKADIDRLKAMQEEQRNETLYVAGTVTFDSDKSCQLSVPGWMKRVYFSKAHGDKEGMIYKTDCVDANGLDIFEVAAWKVRKECGGDSYDKLKSMQAMYAAIVEAPAKKSA